MGKPDYESLVAFLTERFDEDLRWVASFNSDQFNYTVRYIREDLRSELSGLDFDTIVHRSMAVFNRRNVQNVYFHLGDARSLLVEHEQAMALHLYLTESTGVVIKIEQGASVQLPELRAECLARLDS